MTGVDTLEALNPATSPSDAHRAGPAVWDRLWRYAPGDAKDDALLAREAASPRWSLIVDRLESTFGSIRGLRTVELGSGRGDISVLLARAGAEVTLFDRSGPALDQARRRFDRLGLTARFESGDMLGPLDRWAGRFDVAISLGVVEHFRRYRRTAAIRAHYDVLRPGGMAIISVPNALCLPYRLWKFYLERRGWWPYGMERPYSPRELARRSRHAGFTRTETICLNFLESVGNHWVKRLSGRAPQWTDQPSRFDTTMGFILLMFGQRPAAMEKTKD